jgi:23S rRNA maturation mini-RNase III
MMLLTRRMRRYHLCHVRRRDRCHPLVMVHVLVAAPEPRTVLEALQQRHEELTKRYQDAVNKGDNAKARRMDRLTKVNIYL